jgi:formylmethanofuran dehydrogenase subunit B
VAGADSVLCWQTGFPFSVSLSRGYPRYNPGEYSAADLLRRQEVDVCLLVGGESLPALPAEAQVYLRSIPTIVLDNTSQPIPWQPTVRFNTAAYGVHRAGTAYRMDEEPIPLRAVLPSTHPSDGEVLRAILEHL